MFRPPPTSTLFPYTSLFRSHPNMHLYAPGAASYRVVALTIAPDRKSTRLNSSHVENSYAVFCLKKKTVELPGRNLALHHLERIAHRGEHLVPVAGPGLAEEP